ncbi:MAG: prepilin-type N-terminal cleavage/methylation domain-containing protein [Christensenellales bacterium]
MNIKMLLSHTRDKQENHGFTIVELLVVIVVIGILAAITVVAYTGISNRAIIASLQSDLKNDSDQLNLYRINDNVFPGSVTDCPSPAAGNICLKASNGATISKYNNLGNSFILEETNSGGNVTYQIKDIGGPKDVALTTTSGLNCSSGFIAVPGSSTYGTQDFCVAKYEMKIQGQADGNQTYSAAFVPESRASGTPWVNISQTNAIAEAQTACTGCHLITEAEWMTIAQNVLSVPGNWSGGAVGSGYIYSGHNDGAPANSLAASTDGDGYSGTSQTSGNQKRTLTLTNGEVIWDLAGNVHEWTSYQTTGGQPGISGDSYAWREWTAITTSGGLAVNPFPGGTGMSGSGGWTSSNGIGQIFSSADETALHGPNRGGAWSYNNRAGVLTLGLISTPDYVLPVISFRVSR